MKKALLLYFFLAFSLGLEAQSSVYHPFPDSTIWRVDAYCQFNCGVNYYWHYYFDGDTVINGSLHKKMMKSITLTIATWNPPCNLCPWLEGPSYMGAIMDSVPENKVYIVLPSSQNDTVLFDYSIGAGDTAYGAFFPNQTRVVAFVDSLLIGSQYHKRWVFTSSDWFVQGIGSDYGPVDQIPGVTKLICVFDSSGLLLNTGYSSNPHLGCQLINSVEEMGTDIDLQIYQDPHTGHLIVQDHNISKYEAIIEIYTILGERISCTPFKMERIEIDLSYLSSGLYIVQVNNEQFNKSRKIRIAK